MGDMGDGDGGGNVVWRPSVVMSSVTLAYVSFGPKITGHRPWSRSGEPTGQAYGIPFEIPRRPSNLVPLASRSGCGPSAETDKLPPASASRMPSSIAIRPDVYMSDQSDQSIRARETVASRDMGVADSPPNVLPARRYGITPSDWYMAKPCQPA